MLYAALLPPSSYCQEAGHAVGREFNLFVILSFVCHAMSLIMVMLHGAGMGVIASAKHSLPLI